MLRVTHKYVLNLSLDQCTTGTDGSTLGAKLEEHFQSLPTFLLILITLP